MKSHDQFGRAGHAIESLEPRMHLSAYTIQSIAELFHLPAVLHVLAPPAGIETAGYGSAAAALGDIDGDGRTDIAVAAPGRAAGAEGPAIAGRVFIYSGATGAPIRALTDNAAEFGFSLAGIGDVNGDDVPDL